ncbi:MAG TPA: class I SAM-dependent methyltransferase [Acidimicrobiia bacterium]
MNHAAETPRAPHAVLDVESRRRKARKIAAIIETERPLAGLKVLDVGTGAGVISASLGDIVGEQGEVHSVDVVDVRVETAGYEFHLGDGVALPFPDATFDVVISNHCIEHTGGRAEQEYHVRELGRVLRPDGIGYLAVPNRWGPLEPHFKLPGLSWLPTVGLQSRYVRAARRGERYDCRLLSRAEVRELFALAGLDGRERTLEAMHVMAAVEEPSAAFRTVLRAPDALLRAALIAIPTLVFTFRRPERA